mgnify:CR=1 FL=1
MGWAGDEGCAGEVPEGAVGGEGAASAEVEYDSSEEGQTPPVPVEEADAAATSERRGGGDVCTPEDQSSGGASGGGAASEPASSRRFERVPRLLGVCSLSQYSIRASANK